MNLDKVEVIRWREVGADLVHSGGHVVCLGKDEANRLRELIGKVSEAAQAKVNLETYQYVRLEKEVKATMDDFLSLVKTTRENIIRNGNGGLDDPQADVEALQGEDLGDDDREELEAKRDKATPDDVQPLPEGIIGEPIGGIVAGAESAWWAQKKTR